MVVKQIQYEDQTRAFPKPKPWGVRTKSFSRYYEPGKYKIAPTFNDILKYKVGSTANGQSPNPRYKGRRPIPKFMKYKKKTTKRNEKIPKISRWIWYFRWKNRRKTKKAISTNKTSYSRKRTTKKTFSRRNKTRL